MSNSDDFCSVCQLGGAETWRARCKESGRNDPGSWTIQKSLIGGRDIFQSVHAACMLQSVHVLSSGSSKPDCNGWINDCSGARTDSTAPQRDNHSQPSYFGFFSWWTCRTLYTHIYVVGWLLFILPLFLLLNMYLLTHTKTLSHTFCVYIIHSTGDVWAAWLDPGLRNLCGNCWRACY